STVAVRLPGNAIARRIIELADTAVAAPSANPFGYISPTTARHVVTMLGDKVDLVVDGGPCDVGVESTVIDLTGPVPVVARPGGMAVEMIEAVIGPVVISQRSAGPVVSPGQTSSHYAPRTPLYLFDADTLPRAAMAKGIVRPCAALVFDPIRAQELVSWHVFDKVIPLAPDGTLRHAASRLFSILHELDSGVYAALYAERVPDEGLGRAINDRLFRASKKED
ncbi:MAG: Sua5/YciO/YrdC/YwlC family protein, partial [Rectinema sp.]|nr:Sua5/YciO/YrdC/YwlC family protein [Rectinema sp.]